MHATLTFRRHLGKVQMSMIRNRDCSSLKSRCDVRPAVDWLGAVRLFCQASGLPVLPKDLEAATASAPLVLFEATTTPHVVQERILGRFVQQELRNQPPVKKVRGQTMQMLLWLGWCSFAAR